MTDTNKPSNQFDLIVIGAGPGGYVAAIRAAQLGFNTACVEREFLGGTCLNIGCIPSKALLDSSERYYDIKHAVGRHGIKVDGASIDLGTMMKRKDEVVKALTSGVGYLFKKHKIEHLKGSGRILSPGSVEVTAGGATPVIHRTQRILVATGSAPIHLPSLPFDEKY